MNIRDGSKIHLLGRTSAPHQGVTRIHTEDLFADILCDRTHGKSLYQWVMQRRGSAEVLGLGQSYSFDGAKAQATGAMSDLSRKQKASESGD